MVEQLFCNIDDKSVVYRSVSDLFGVCTYFLVDDKKILIIDPGKLSDEVYNWLLPFTNHQKYIYLTHEHFDHHFDVNKLMEFKNTYLYLYSDEFKNALCNSRTNLSYYYNTPIETSTKNTIDLLFLNLLKTPGHGKFSVCFLNKNLLFGGDTVIEKQYLVLKLPGSNKNFFKESMEKLKKIIPKDTIVLPGHGSLFCFDSWKI